MSKDIDTVIASNIRYLFEIEFDQKKNYLLSSCVSRRRDFFTMNLMDNIVYLTALIIKLQCQFLRQWCRTHSKNVVFFLDRAFFILDNNFQIF